MAQTLYVIMQTGAMLTHGCAISLRRACEARNITFEPIICDTFSLEEAVAMNAAPGSLLYRISTSPKAQRLESTLVLRHSGIFTTIYRDKVLKMPARDFSEIHEQMAQGLCIIPTKIVDAVWRTYDTDKLVSIIDELGGFPVIIKRLGLAHGRGVQKVEDSMALQSLLAETDLEKINMIARKYLVHYRHYRFIIIDDSVAAVIEYHVPADDFRTNASEPVVSAVPINDMPEATQKLAIDSVRLRASILGGVDILVDQTDGTAYLAEANIPCYFARAEDPTGTDIGGELVDALLRKQQQERV